MEDRLNVAPRMYSGTLHSSVSHAADELFPIRHMNSMQPGTVHVPLRSDAGLMWTQHFVAHRMYTSSSNIRFYVWKVRQTDACCDVVHRKFVSKCCHGLLTTETST